MSAPLIIKENGIAPTATGSSRRVGAAVAPLAGDDFDRDVWCLLGLPIDICDVPQAAIAVEAAVRDRRRLSLVTPNVNWLVRALSDQAMRRQILDADLSLADGAPLVLIARLLGVPQKRRAAGADMFEALRRRPGFRGRRIRVFFFGGRDGSAEAADRRLKSERGGMEAAGWLNPGHGDLASMSGASTIRAINAAEPDFVIVALGAAKGQAWIERNKEDLTAPVIAHLGAVVDFTSGAIARAPAFAARLGMEWIWRIMAEPALAGRYFKDGAALARIALGRLAPQLILRDAARSGSPASASVEPERNRTVIRIEGDATRETLGPVRAAFRQAAAAGGAATLDVTRAGRIDRAFLGLVLMLEKHLRRRGAVLTMTGLSPRHARLFKANAMAYPAAATGDVDAPRSAGAPATAV